MAKKKQHKSLASSSQNQQRAHRINRLKETCELLLGKGTAKIFSPTDFKYLDELMYPSARMSVTVNNYCTQEEASYYKQIFHHQLQSRTTTTITGAEISLAQFLKEGLTLIFYVEAMIHEEPERSGPYAQLFEPYLERKDAMYRPIIEAVQTALQLSTIKSDWATQLMHYSVEDLVGFSNSRISSEIKVWFKPVPKESLEIDGKKREILHLGWCDTFGKFEQLYLQPSKIGLRHTSKTKLPVFIQRHALQRLQQRLGLLDGPVQYQLYESLRQDQPKYKSQGSHSLVELQCFDIKLGYLVCCIVQEKIIIRTFLFLTNEGSPEGDKLKESSSLARIDMQYLELDTLQGISRYKLQHHPELSQLFEQSGCSQLLDLSNLSLFFKQENSEKDPNLLLKYLMMQKITVDNRANNQSSTLQESSCSAISALD